MLTHTYGSVHTHAQAGAFGATCESFASCSHISSLPHTSQRVGSAGLHMQMQHRCTTARACKRRTHSCVRVRPCAWVCVLCARAAASGRWALRKDARRPFEDAKHFGCNRVAELRRQLRPLPPRTHLHTRAWLCLQRSPTRANKHTQPPTERTSARRKQPRARWSAASAWSNPAASCAHRLACRYHRDSYPAAWLGDRSRVVREHSRPTRSGPRRAQGPGSVRHNSAQAAYSRRSSTHVGPRK